MGAVATRVEQAIEHACRFLAAAQQPDGFWRDYALAPGPSTQWVTAFVGYALAVAGARTGDDPLARALLALQSSVRSAGWGYNAAIAPDADSTSWAIRLFLRTGTAVPIEPVPVLTADLGPNGGARTFACGPRYGRWTLEHIDVTAVVALALKEAGAGDAVVCRAREWILGGRTHDGLWTGFWWTFDAYVIAQTLELLAATGGVPHPVAEASRRYLKQRADPDTVMEAASLLIIAQRTQVSGRVWRDLLLARQLTDGSWPPSRGLRVPDQHGSGTDGEVFADANRLMSTAMAVMALSMV